VRADGDRRRDRRRPHLEERPRERRDRERAVERDAQRRLVARALGEGYRTVLPHGVYPSALLFLEVPPEEVDVNVHPAKTEVRFRRSGAVADAVRDSVRAALYAGGYLRDDASFAADVSVEEFAGGYEQVEGVRKGGDDYAPASSFLSDTASDVRLDAAEAPAARQESIEFGWTPAPDLSPVGREAEGERQRSSASALGPVARSAGAAPVSDESPRDEDESAAVLRPEDLRPQHPQPEAREARAAGVTLPPLNSAAGIVRGVAPEQLSPDIRPLGQLEESFILATDPEGLLLIDQHAAHERVLFDKYRRLEEARRPESQSLLVPETFDLSPAQAAAFDEVAGELEGVGFSLTRLSGRTVAVRAVPADLQPAEARNLLSEILDTVDSERRGRARETLRDEVAASLACHAAIKVNMPLTHEKMRWLIDRLLLTSSPTTCPHGRPAILRLTKRDIERGFHRP
jgi:DNA mismatch repair protein MutL